MRATLETVSPQILSGSLLALALSLNSASVLAADAFVSKVERMLREHQLVRMVDADVEGAQKQISVERSAYYPRLTLQGNTGRERIERDTGSSGIFKPHELSVQLNQLLSDFGATGARVDAARSVADKEEQERALQVQNLLLAAVEAQLRLIRARQSHEFARESEANILRQTQLESARVEAGRGYATDVLQAKAQLAGAEARRVRASLLLAEAHNRYKAVFDEEPPAGELQGLEAPLTLMPRSEAELDEAVIQENPDTQAALARQRVASSERRAQVRREWAPRVDVLLSHSNAYEQDGAIGKKDDSRVMLRLNWNFDLGMRAVHVADATQAAVNSAMAKTDYVRVQAGEEARSAWANWQMSQQRAAYLDNQVQISASFLELARRERELGRRSLLDLLNGETALINARGDALEARIDEIIAAFRVLRASGRLQASLFSRPGVITDASRWTTLATAPAARPIASAEPITAAPAAESGLPQAEQVGAFLEQWRNAWATGDVATYLASYAPDFQPPGGLSRQAWEAQRQDRIKAAGNISLSLGEARIQQAGELLQVSFEQHYRSPRYADKVRKQLLLRRTGEALQITSETQSSLR